MRKEIEKLNVEKKGIKGFKEENKKLKEEIEKLKKRIVFLEMYYENKHLD